MPYLETYRAYVRFTDGNETAWNGLRKAQAQWRYYWIKRTADSQNKLHGKQFKEFGWTREFQA